MPLINQYPESKLQVLSLEQVMLAVRNTWFHSVYMLPEYMKRKLKQQW
jgi:hypothetical protein